MAEESGENEEEETIDVIKLPAALHPYLGTVGHFQFLHETMLSMDHVHGRGFRPSSTPDPEETDTHKRVELVPISPHACPPPLQFASIVDISIRPKLSGTYKVFGTVKVGPRHALVIFFRLTVTTQVEEGTGSSITVVEVATRTRGREKTKEENEGNMFRSGEKDGVSSSSPRLFEDTFISQDKEKRGKMRQRIK